MNAVAYYANIIATPIFFIVVLVKNMYRLNKQAIRWSVSETSAALASNRRYFKNQKHKEQE